MSVVNINDIGLIVSDFHKIVSCSASREGVHQEECLQIRFLHHTNLLKVADTVKRAQERRRASLLEVRKD